MIRFLAAIKIIIFTFGLVVANNRRASLWTKASSASFTTFTRDLIVNGDKADHASFPFFAHGSGCGAVLIHSDILVSAAHCQGAFNYNLTMIDEQGQEFNRTVHIDTQVRHRKFDLYWPTYFVWDIMVMKLTEPIYDVTPIAWNSDEETPANGEILTAIGLGNTEYNGNSSDVLLQADMVHIDSNTCRMKMQGFYEEYGFDDEACKLEISNHSLCVEPTEEKKAETCQVSYPHFCVLKFPKRDIPIPAKQFCLLCILLSSGRLRRTTPHSR